MAHRPNEEDGDDLTPMIIVTALVTVLLVQLGRLLLGDGLASDSLLYDSDAYMWLHRVEALAEGRGWFDHREPRINPPDGHVQHWTRPLDGLLLIGGHLLRPVLGFRDGLALWGNLISPVLLVLSTWVMFRVSRLLLPRREAILSAAIFALHPMILITFAWGRPDHHSLLAFGQVLFLYFFLRFFLAAEDQHGEEEQDKRTLWAFWAGLVGALAIWANVEALSFVLMGLAALGLWWLVGRRDLVLSNVAMAAGLFSGTVIAVLVERGPNFFVIYPIDTTGFPYVVLFGLTLLFWVGLAIWSNFGGGRFGVAGRGLVALVCAGMVLAVMAVTMPSFFAGPFAEVDELYRQVRLQYIGEQLPALPWGSSPLLGVVGRALALFGIFFVALVEYARRARDGGDTARRWAWSILAVMGLIYGALALDAVRWAAYLPAAASLGFALVGGRWLDRVERRRQQKGGSLLRPLVVGAILLGFATVGLVVEEVAEIASEPTTMQEVTTTDSTRADDCDLRPAVDALQAREGVSPEALVLIDPDRGSELLYRTDFSVLAVANHRQQPGFTLFYETMTTDDAVDSHDRLRRRGVDVVMVCEPRIWETLRRQGEAVIEQLGRGESPPGLERWMGPEQTGGWWIYGIN